MSECLLQNKLGYLDPDVGEVPVFGIAALANESRQTIVVGQRQRELHLL